MKILRSALVAAVIFVSLSASAGAQTRGAYADGVYASSYVDEELGRVTVRVEVRDGSIASVTLPEGKGDVDLDDESLGSFLEELVSAKDFMAVDAVSGATQSCDLLKYAVQRALEAAGGKQ